MYPAGSGISGPQAVAARHVSGIRLLSISILRKLGLLGVNRYPDLHPVNPAAGRSLGVFRLFLVVRRKLGSVRLNRYPDSVGLNSAGSGAWAVPGLAASAWSVAAPLARAPPGRPQAGLDLSKGHITTWITFT